MPNIHGEPLNSDYAVVRDKHATARPNVLLRLDAMTSDEVYDLSLRDAPRETLVAECKALRKMLLAERKQVKALEERLSKPSAELRWPWFDLR